jgi:Mrp family chromosome partitioning ATPase
MDTTQQLRTLWASKHWLALFALVAALATYFVSSRLDERYEAEALAQVIPAQQAEGFGLSTDQLLQTTNFYAELARTTRVLEAAQREGGFREPITDEVDVAGKPDLLVLEFTGTAPEPRVAAAYANAYAQAFAQEVGDLLEAERRRTLAGPQRQIADIERRLRGAAPGSSLATALEAELQALQGRLADITVSPIDTVRIIQPAIAPSSPAYPNPVRNALLAALLALVIAAGGVLLMRTFSDRYSSVDEAALDLRLPVLAELPRASAQDARALEAFRKLRAQVEFSMAADPPEAVGAAVAHRRARRDKDQRNVLLVTSPEPGAGKTYVSSNLAGALAADGGAVMVVDGDVRRPNMHNVLDLPQEPGLGDVLAGLEPARARVRLPEVPGEDRAARTLAAQQLTHRVPLRDAVRRRGGSLDALTAGRLAEDTAERLSSDTMASLVERLHDDYDYVVLDSPPVLAIVDAVVLSRYADGIVLVIDARRGRRQNILRAVATLRAVDAPILGFVFNKTDVSSGDYGYYGTYPARERDGAEVR